MKMIGDITKFSFGEMTSNGNGKTSVSGTSGFVLIIVGAIAFLTSLIASICGKLGIEYVYASFAVIVIGAGLLGYKKKISKEILSKSPFDMLNDDDDDVKDVAQPETKSEEPKTAEVVSDSQR